MTQIEALESRRLLSATALSTALSPTTPHVAQSASIAAALRAPSSVSTEQIGTTALKVNWPAVPGAVKYSIRYSPGAYVDAPKGGRKTAYAAGSRTSVTLSDLRPFTLYSLQVATIGADGVSGPVRQAVAWTAKPATTRRYLYAVDLPQNRRGFRTLRPQIQVFDIDAGHKWVRNIPLPAGIYNARGVAASVETGRLYLSFFTKFDTGYQPGGLLCMDLHTDKVLWKKLYDPKVVPSPDRFALTPDGRKIYMPSGEDGDSDVWTVIDAFTGNPVRQIHHVTSPHNTNVSVDGRYVFLEGQENAPQDPKLRHTVAVVDTTTDRIVRRVGPFAGVVRPFTINGTSSLVFATVNDMIGFQVGDVATGRVLYTAKPPGLTQPEPRNYIHSHGIALTPDEREVWVVDQDRPGVHVWDVSKLPASAPRYVGFVATRKQGMNLEGQPDSAAKNDPNLLAWIVSGYDGRYMYPETGEIVEVATHKVVGQLRSKQLNSDGRLVWAPYTHSRHILEVVFDRGRLAHVTDQFGVGRVR